MRAVNLMIIFALSSIFLSSCEGNTSKMSFYAVLSPSNVSQFPQDLASLATKHGLTPHVGEATDDQGHTLHVVEAKGRWMRLWSQNLPLSGRENPDLCGKYTEAHPDAGQYIVTITTRLPLLNKGEATELAIELQHELSKLGYEIRENPVVCSSLAKSGL